MKSYNPAKGLALIFTEFVATTTKSAYGLGNLQLRFLYTFNTSILFMGIKIVPKNFFSEEWLIAPAIFIYGLNNIFR